MKRWLILILLVTTLAIPAPGCGAYTYTDSEQTIQVWVGNEFIIALGANPTTGYGWQESYDTAMLELVERKYVAEETDEELAGAGGIEYFRFRALERGETQITLDYQRSREETVIEQRVFTVTIHDNDLN